MEFGNKHRILVIFFTKAQTVCDLSNRRDEPNTQKYPGRYVHMSCILHRNRSFWKQNTCSVLLNMDQFQTSAFGKGLNSRRVILHKAPPHSWLPYVSISVPFSCQSSDPSGRVHRDKLVPVSKQENTSQNRGLTFV